jgi:glucose dehydrogenase
MRLVEQFFVGLIVFGITFIIARCLFGQIGPVKTKSGRVGLRILGIILCASVMLIPCDWSIWGIGNSYIETLPRRALTTLFVVVVIIYGTRGSR